MTLLAAVLLAFVAVVWLADRLLPPVFLAKVTMEIRPDQSFSTFGSSRRSEFDPEFVPTHFRILRSEQVLDQVIVNLKLTEEWSARGTPMPRKEAQKALLGMLELRTVATTGLIEIRIYSRDPVRAANIANTFAVVYQQKRLSELQKQIDNGMEQLRDEVEKQRKRTEDYQSEAARIREQFHLFDPTPDEQGSRITSQVGTVAGPGETEGINRYSEAKARYLQAKRIYEAAKTSYATQLFERGIDFDPAKIWEKAEPPKEPLHLTYARFRYAFVR